MKFCFYTPIAYDYKYAYPSIMSYYDIADWIVLAIDKDRISWNNQKYDFNFHDFLKKIKSIDKDKKISIFEGDFHKFKTPIDNDTDERNLISKYIENNLPDYDKNWYMIGIDSDEVLLNPKEFRIWLDENSYALNDEEMKMHPVNRRRHSNVHALWYSVYKSYGDKVLVTLPHEWAMIGTKIVNSYRKCRYTSPAHELRSPLKILHYSWGRSRDEVLQKIRNWSHSSQFNIDNYFRVWDNVSLNNYSKLRNFHPLNVQGAWERLKLMELNQFNLSKKILDELNGITS